MSEILLFIAELVLDSLGLAADLRWAPPAEHQVPRRKRRRLGVALIASFALLLGTVFLHVFLRTRGVPRQVLLWTTLASIGVFLVCLVIAVRWALKERE